MILRNTSTSEDQSCSELEHFSTGGKGDEILEKLQEDIDSLSEQITKLTETRDRLEELRESLEDVRGHGSEVLDVVVRLDGDLYDVKRSFLS